MKTKLQKFDVCDQCFCVQMLDADCVCGYDKYKTIKLEYEVCACCGHVVNDGSPADTPYNDEQLKNHNF